MLTYNGPRTDVTDTTTYAYYNDLDGSNEPWSNGAQLYTVTNAKSHVTTYGDYHFTGQPLDITDPNDVEEEFTYNNRGQVETRTLHAESDQETQYVYYDDGLLNYVVHPEGNITEYTYNEQHWVTDREEKPDLQTSFHRAYYEYDTEGNRITEEFYEWNGSSLDITKQTTFDYDDYNRLEKIRT